MLHLRARDLARKLEHGPARSIALSTVAGGVGLAAGKLEDARKTPLVAIAAGAGLQLLGLRTLGDGAFAGGATILGYRLGARMSRRSAPPVATVTPGTPTVRPHHARRRAG
jgi:hypothetical protein